MMDIRGLAYVVAETTDLPRWKNFAEKVLGMMTEPAPNGGLYVRMDERQFRFAVQPGSRDAYVASGWEVADKAAFDHAVQTLRNAHVELVLEDASFCRLRRAQQVVSFQDPSGNRHEVIWGFQSDFTHFASPTGVSNFVTGPIGMGHTVLPAPNFEATGTVRILSEHRSLLRCIACRLQPVAPAFARLHVLLQVQHLL